ncbi:MAG: GDP-mannose 4,6-dehydratase, partial [Vicinamibacterales bacterium]|nr:GDP-mannose 4,6-dehydratase [Vicinamibacterales bacterium]
YGESKLAFERALSWFQVAHSFRIGSLRYFNAAGAGPRCGERHEPETHLIPLVLEAAAGKREHISIFGSDYPTRDGTCVRDYIHVLDLADAHVLALAMLVQSESLMAIYNLGCGGAGHTNKEVVDCAGRVTGRAIRTLFAPRRAGDPPVLVASSAKARSELGWTPKRERLEEIIESAWKWYCSRT